MSFLIINADDYGMDACRDLGILLGIALGCVSSVSAVVTGEDRSVRKWSFYILKKMMRNKSIGRHVDLTSEELLSHKQEDLFDNFKPLYYDKRDFWRGATLNKLNMRSLERDVLDQINKLKNIFGFAPTHIDGHNHVQVASREIYLLFKNYPACYPDH